MINDEYSRRSRSDKIWRSTFALGKIQTLSSRFFEALKRLPSVKLVKSMSLKTFLNVKLVILFK